MDPHSALPETDPFALFDAWLGDAAAAEPNDPNAMALATADAGGAPSVRMVLLKGHGPALGEDGAGGFVFYSHADGRKGTEIAANPQAALLFHWKSLRRQIRIEGRLEDVPAATADAYFATRSRDSQLGAVASDQSRPLPSRETYVERFDAAQARFAGGPVARPATWTGWRVIPHAIEFWIDRPGRLHDRRRYTRDPGADGGGASHGWRSTLLYP